MMNRRFSSSSGFGSWSGNSPSGTQYISTRSSASRSRSGPTIGPAIPLPPSTTTLSGLTLRRVDERERVGVEVVVDVDLLDRAAAGRVAEPGFDLAPDVADPGVAGERQRPLADQLDPGVGLRVVRGGDHRAAVELARADQVVEHLGGDHAGVEDGRALGDEPVAHRGRHLRRLSRMSRPRPTRSSLGWLAAQPAEHAGEGAADG